MKSKNEQLDILFDKAHNTSAGSRLFSQDDIRNLLGSTAPSSQQTIQQGIRPMIMASTAAGIATLIVAGSMLFPSGTSTTNQQQNGQTATVQTVQTAPLAALPKQTATERTTAAQHNNTPVVAMAPAKVAEKHTTPPQGNHEKNAPLVNVQGIHTMELSNSELRALGLERTNNGELKVYSRKNNGDVTYMAFSMQGMSFNPTERVQHSATFYASTALRMITDDQGMRRMNSYTTDDKEQEITSTIPKDVTVIFLPNHEDINHSTVIEVHGSGKEQTTVQRAATAREIENHLQSEKRSQEFDAHLNDYIRVNKWIAIAVPMGIPYTEQDKANKRWRPDFILWFEPTPELVAALPEQYRQALTRELNLATDEKALAENNVETPEPGKGFLGVWQARAGVLTASAVSPNPVKNQMVTVSYTLAEQRTVRINLRALSGAVLRPLVEAQNKAAGTWREETTIGALPPGMYIVTIETEKGEHTVQRLIVE